MRFRVSYIALALALFFEIFHPVSLGAADLSVIPSVSAQGAYSNNINYALSNKITDFTFSVSPSAAFNYTTDVGNLQGVLSLTELQYVKETQYDHLDQNYQINGRYQLFPRLGLTMQTAYSVNSTLQQALTTSGIITSHIPQTYITLGPGISYALTERLTATLGYAFNQANSQDPQFTNYTSQQGNLSLSYPLNNEKTTIGGTVTASETDYANNDVTRQGGIYLSADHKFSEVWRVSFLGGLDYISTNNTSVVSTPVSSPTSSLYSLSPQLGRQSSFEPHIDASLTRSWTNTSLSVRYQRTQPPSGLGAPVTFNMVSVSLSHDFNERLSGSMAGTYSSSQPINVSGGFETSLYQLSPQLSYKLTENLSLIPACSFGLLQELGKSANIVGASLMLTYSYPFFHYQK
jgi:hypothetical protein